jgi:hypothetical protein
MDVYVAVSGIQFSLLTLNGMSCLSQNGTQRNTTFKLYLEWSMRKLLYIFPLWKIITLESVIVIDDASEYVSCYVISFSACREFHGYIAFKIAQLSILLIFVYRLNQSKFKKNEKKYPLFRPPLFWTTTCPLHLHVAKLVTPDVKVHICSKYFHYI